MQVVGDFEVFRRREQVRERLLELVQSSRRKVLSALIRL